MLKKIKFSKLAVVIFLTVLIWVWADRALEETRSFPTATIVIGRTAPNLLVSFTSGSTIDVNQINLRGPASVVNNLEQVINNDPKKLEFTLYPERLGINKAGEYPINVQEIIRQSSWIKDSGLSVEGCEPSKVMVTAVDLVKKDLDVQCLDNNLETPQTVSMYVPADWRLPAQVVLSDDERTRAMQQPIRKKPFIMLPNGERREADTFVEIKLPPQDKILPRYTIANATLGYTLSETLLKGEYEIKVETYSLMDILNIEIFASPEAKDAYENQDYQVILEILDTDIAETIKNKVVRRKVYYKFPEEFVRANKISLAREKAEARFTVKAKEQSEVPSD